MLCVPATSAAVERVFSHGGLSNQIGLLPDVHNTFIDTFGSILARE